VAKGDVIPVRCTDDEQKARWKAAAEREMVSLSRFACLAMDERAGVAAVDPAGIREGKRAPLASRPGERRELCPHRRRPDQFCPRCDR
jgi:hypothetical protein